MGLEKAFLAGGAIPEDVQDLVDLAKLRKHAGLDEDGDIVVLDEKTGEPSGLTLSQYVEKTKKTRAKNFLPTETTGSGSVAGTRGLGGKNVSITRAEAQNAQNYKAAKAAAEKQGGRVIIVE
jgi:hypothetical protein